MEPGRHDATDDVGQNQSIDQPTRDIGAIAAATVAGGAAAAAYINAKWHIGKDARFLLTMLMARKAVERAGNGDGNFPFPMLKLV
jgi:hypothetical protein